MKVCSCRSNELWSDLLGRFMAQWGTAQMDRRGEVPRLPPSYSIPTLALRGCCTLFTHAASSEQESKIHFHMWRVAWGQPGVPRCPQALVTNTKFSPTFEVGVLRHQSGSHCIRDRMNSGRKEHFYLWGVCEVWQIGHWQCTGLYWPLWETSWVGPGCREKYC